MQSWLRHNPAPKESDLLNIARALLTAQPEMAPLIRLANEIALATDQRDPREALARSLSGFLSVLKTASGRIAPHFSQRLRRKWNGNKWDLMTYSYSSTVLKAIRRARNRIGIVWCSEGRPALEGRRTAQAVAGMGLPVYFTTDAALPYSVCIAEALVLGADSIQQYLNTICFENKVGSNALVESARFFKTPVWILADTTKLLPLALVRLGSQEKEKPIREVWAGAPKGVSVWNYYFESFPYAKGLDVLTERGWLSYAQLLHALASIRVSRRMKELMNGQPAVA